MIIDGHAYCFPPLGEANGFATAREHLRYLQREMADHHQPVWRLSDRAPGDNTRLADPADRSLGGLREVGFRAGGFGRFVWTVDGQPYAKQYLPPYCADLSHSPEQLVAQMDYAGIDRAVLHANPIMGLLNDYLAACVRRFPDRLLALASIREWEIEKDPEGAAAEVARAYALGLQGYQFILNSRHRHGVTDPWDGPRVRPFWDRVVALGKPVFFTLSAWPRPTVEDYLGQLRIWRGWLERYPQAAAVHTHGFPWRLFRHENRLRLPEAVFEPFQHASARLQLLFPIALGNVWDFPYRELHPTIAQLVDTLGSDRLMYGTDMPNVERFCTYRQTLDAFRVHCRGLLRDEDIANIVGGTAARLFGLDGAGR
ncbi:MAG: amidohydrolase family protein [Candidatus Rokubacteria bacterium]|nr:amidohydrolase family protein [Candidatus Rokubacteria bacterium]